MHFKSLLIFAQLILAISVHSQIVTTLYNSPSFQFTDDIIEDSDGNLYGADYSGSNVYKLTPEGDVSVFLSGLDSPNGLAFDSNGNLFVADNTGNLIYKVAPDGTTLETYDFTNPSGLIKEFDSDTIVFTSYNPSSLNKLAPDGTILPYFNDPVLNGPVGMAYDEFNNLYVANFNNRRIYRIDGQELIYIAQVPGASFTSCGFITHANGFLYATNFSTHRVYKINPFYTDSIVGYYGSSFGTSDGAYNQAQFSNPNGIRASLSGDSIYVTQYDDGAIRIMKDLILSNQNEQIPSTTVAYPNPVVTELHIEPDHLFTVRSLDIIDSSGRLVKALEVESNDLINVHLEGLEQGNYFVRLNRTNSTTEWIKIIKL